MEGEEATKTAQDVFPPKGERQAEERDGGPVPELPDGSDELEYHAGSGRPSLGKIVSEILARAIVNIEIGERLLADHSAEPDRSVLLTLEGGTLRDIATWSATFHDRRQLMDLSGLIESWRWEGELVALPDLFHIMFTRNEPLQKPRSFRDMLQLNGDFVQIAEGLLKLGESDLAVEAAQKVKMNVDNLHVGLGSLEELLAPVSESTMDSIKASMDAITKEIENLNRAFREIETRRQMLLEHGARAAGYFKFSATKINKSLELSNDQTIVSYSKLDYARSVLCHHKFTPEQNYVEFEIHAKACVGATTTGVPDLSSSLGRRTLEWGYLSDGRVQCAGRLIQGRQFESGSKVGIAINFRDLSLSFYLNGACVYTDTNTGLTAEMDIYPGVTLMSTGRVQILP